MTAFDPAEVPTEADGCGYWNGAEQRYCRATPTRRYLPGWRCQEHSPYVLRTGGEPR